MSTLGHDPDEDVRQLLNQDGQGPGAAHDSGVLRAARELAAAPIGVTGPKAVPAPAVVPAPNAVAAPAVVPTPAVVLAPRFRRAARMRTWALAASVTIVLIGSTLEWRARHPTQLTTDVGSPTAGLWIAPNLIEPGLTRGQREAPRIDFARGATTGRWRRRMTEPDTSKAFDA